MGAIPDPGPESLESRIRERQAAAFAPRVVAPGNGQALTAGRGGISPQGVVMNITVNSGFLFKESLKPMPTEVLRKMYDELLAEISRRGDTL
jgi:hypothetical protein